MKNMLIAFIAILCGIVIILIGFTMYGRSVRQVELDNALKSSMEESLTNLMYEETGIKDEKEWKKAFLESLTIQINSESNLTVTFLETDMEKGILSVEAILTWKHPIGTIGTVSSTMTAILEEYDEYKEGTD